MSHAHDAEPTIITLINPSPAEVDELRRRLDLHPLLVLDAIGIAHLATAEHQALAVHPQ